MTLSKEGTHHLAIVFHLMIVQIFDDLPGFLGKLEFFIHFDACFLRPVIGLLDQLREIPEYTCIHHAGHLDLVIGDGCAGKHGNGSSRQVQILFFGNEILHPDLLAAIFFVKRFLKFQQINISELAKIANMNGLEFLESKILIQDHQPFRSHGHIQAVHHHHIQVPGEVKVVIRMERCQKLLCDLRKDGSSFPEDIFVNVEAAGVMIDIRTFLRV